MSHNTITPRRLTALDRTTAPIGLGCMGMSWGYATPQTSNEPANIAVIHAALDRGITLLDTSDAYASGHNEHLIGRALTGRRDEAIIATKGGLISSYPNGRPHVERDASPTHLRTAIDASLTRLGTDHIDLYYLHRVDPTIPLEDSWGTLADVVTAGKIRALGLSEVTTEQADLAHQIHPVAAIQSELSLWTRDPIDPDNDIVTWCADHDANFIGFSPLGRGFLTGALDPRTLPSGDMRTAMPRFTAHATHHNQQLLATIRAVADRHATTPAAVALAWVLAQGPHVIPIPGTTKTERLDQNLDAARMNLTPEDMHELNTMPTATGSRY